ncbi:MAG: hypothetical protein ACPGN3_00625 [Opitutales bacterium]
MFLISLLAVSLSGNTGTRPQAKVHEIQKDQAVIAEIIPLSNADLIRIDGNYEHSLAPGVVCTVANGAITKGEVIIIHTRTETAYALITEFSGQGDFLPGDRITPKRSITF